MIMQRQAQLFSFHFHHLSRFQDIQHAIFTRQGGCSQPPYAELNFACGVGDAEAAVAANREKVAHWLGEAAIVAANQVHGAAILTIAPDDARPATSEKRVGDAMITARPNLALTIQTADCQAVMLYDPARRIIANVHSGWRGSVQNIVGQTVKRMKAEFGCRAEDILAGIGPSLGPCCAEFIHYRTELPQSFWRYRSAADHFNFWAITRDQLQAEGLGARQLEFSHLCTACNPQLFYSYRKSKITGRLAAVIAMNA